MAYDLESLLEPVTEDAPAGPDLSVESRRLAWIDAFDQRPELDPVTGEMTEPADIDWDQIKQDLVAELARTKDLWLAVYLAIAGARSTDLPAIHAGLATLAGLLERFWDDVHPRIDPDFGTSARSAHCGSLSDRREFLNPLGRVAVIRHDRLGDFCLDDLVAIREAGQAHERSGQLDAVLRSGAPALQEACALLEGCLASLREAGRIFTAQAGSAETPNFKPAYERFDKLIAGVRHFTPGAASPASSVGGETSEAYASPQATGAPGRIETRDDVMKALDAVCDYYRRREPSSPVMLALLRAKSWVQMDFMAVMADIAPNSLEDVRNVLIRREEPE